MNKLKSFEVICVVAMGKNRVIGDGDSLLWHLPNDLKRVKSLTMGCPLIMGRRTWESIGRPLPGRASIVMTRDTSWQAEGAIAVPSLKKAISVAKTWLEEQDSTEHRIILFGGGQIYKEGLSVCNKIEATLIDVSPNGGVSFPDTPSQEWDDHCLKIFGADGDLPAYRYVRMTRKVPVFQT